MAILDDRLIEIHAPDYTVVFESLAITGSAPPSGLHSVFVGTSNTVDFTDCEFSGHGDEITGGGAVRLAFGVASATFENCDFTGNRSADVGAAISSSAEMLVLRTSTFLDNVCPDFGGAQYLESTGLGPSTITITSSHFEDNQSRRGGAIWAGEDTDVTMSNSTFRENRAETVVEGQEGLFSNSADAIYTAADLTI